MARSIALVFAALVVAALIAAPRGAEGAISCGTVTQYMSPCISYLRGAGPLTPACCKGVGGLNSAASSTPDRQQACNCLKTAATKISGLNMGTAGGLPGKCGVNLPYKISTSINCATVH